VAREGDRSRLQAVTSSRCWPWRPSCSPPASDNWITVVLDRRTRETPDEAVKEGRGSAGRPLRPEGRPGLPAAAPRGTPAGSCERPLNRASRRRVGLIRLHPTDRFFTWNPLCRAGASRSYARWPTPATRADLTVPRQLGEAATDLLERDVGGAG